jgi:hypothetical protein
MVSTSGDTEGDAEVVGHEIPVAPDGEESNASVGIVYDVPFGQVFHPSIFMISKTHVQRDRSPPSVNVQLQTTTKAPRHGPVSEILSGELGVVPPIIIQTGSRVEIGEAPKRVDIGPSHGKRQGQLRTNTAEEDVVVGIQIGPDSAAYSLEANSL